MYISFDCVFLCLYLNGLDCRAEAYLSSCILSSLSFLLDTLKEYFEQYGQVKEVTIKYDRETQKSRSVWYRTRNLQLCCPCGTCSILVMCTQDSDFGRGVVPQICDNGEVSLHFHLPSFLQGICICSLHRGRISTKGPRCW